MLRETCFLAGSQRTQASMSYNRDTTAGCGSDALIHTTACATVGDCQVCHASPYTLCMSKTTMQERQLAKSDAFCDITI